MDTLDGQMSHIRKLLATQKIDAVDFKAMKADHAEQMMRLEAKLAGLDDAPPDIDELLTAGINNLLGLSEVYKKAKIEGKRELIGSIYPEKLSFDGNVVRTTRVNELASRIYLMNNEIGNKKNRTSLKKSNLSCYVGATGFEPTTSTSRTWRATGLRYAPK